MLWLVLSMLVALAVSGCQKPLTWTKPGATQQDYDAEAFNCEKRRHESGFSGLGFSKPDGSPARSRYLDNCLAARGWAPTRAVE